MRRIVATSLLVLLALSPCATYAQPIPTPQPALATASYPLPPRDGTIDTYFGTQVPDPYRPLENIDAPATLAWEKAEQQLTRSYLDAIPGRDRIAAHLARTTNYPKMGAPSHTLNQYFYYYNSGLQNQYVLYTKRGLHGKPRVLVDPNTLSKDGTVALASTKASWDARYLAYSTQSAGSDWETWHVRDISTGKDLPDVLRWSKYVSASWLPDNSGFFYARFPTPKPGDERKSAQFNQALYLHKLGTPQSADTLFYSRPDHPDWYLDLSITQDKRYAIITTALGTSPNNRLFYADLRDPKRRVHPMFPVADATYTVVDNEGTRFLVQTTKNAPNGKVVSLNLASPSTLTTVISEAPQALASVAIAGHRLFASYLVDAHSAIKVYDYRGNHIRDVALPGIGNAEGFDGWRDDKTVYYNFNGYTSPYVIYSYDIASGKSTLYVRPKIEYDESLFQTDEVFYSSKDGTRVPMMIAHRKGIALDGSHPTILYGYGGFDISITPYFSTFIAAWLEMGGIYAVANIRGGAEYGESWHTAGMLDKKQNVFDDFIAAGEYLKAKGYTSTAKLAIKGESNGGLLIGAVETERPDLAGAALAGVGVMDLLRFDKFTVGHGWIPEYGCATCSKDQFENLLKLSPVQNVRPNTAYPATMIMTADHDDRVFPAHSFKFAATMQADQSGTAPILLRIESNAGHGAGTPLSKDIDEYADMYAFLVKNLDMTLPADFK